MYNFQKKYPYYAENGITATSANYIANLGKEHYRTILKELNNACFYTTEANIVGLPESYVITPGITPDNFASIPDKLSKIYTINALIAWLREAIKKRQAMFDELEGLSSVEYAMLTDQSSQLIESEIKALSMFDLPQETSSIDEMWQTHYLTSQKETLQNALQQMSKALNALGSFDGTLTTLSDVEANGDRVDIDIFTAATASVEQMQHMLATLKERFLTLSAEFSSIIEKQTMLKQEQLQKKHAYLTSLERQKEKYYTTLYNDTKLFKNAEKRKISNYRIVIPEMLRPIFDELNNA